MDLSKENFIGDIKVPKTASIELIITLITRGFSSAVCKEPCVIYIRNGA